jgi:S-methylmethionine-dependent homocysteine/selenocysteine methylase
MNATPLPQLSGTPLVTDGGMETDLIFHHGVDLPHFAAFPLLETPAGRDQLTRYYDGYAAVAAGAGAGLLLEAPTWRASPDWGALLGYDAAGLARVNGAAVEFLRGLRERYAGSLGGQDTLVAGMVGPRSDGYQPGEAMSADEAQEYHGPQIRAFAAAGADLVSALTLTSAGEATGIVRAARDAGLPVAISFTVETDGTLADGGTLAGTIGAVDAAAAPDYFGVNCSHPEHVGPALAGADGASWRERIAGVRYNASALSHAELDESDELDEGDPAALAAAHRRLAPLLPRLSVLGGCCGTDARHVAALWAS